MHVALVVGSYFTKSSLWCVVTCVRACRMSSALLSRFDLVFILLDRPDEEMDCLLSEHVMSLHGRREKAKDKGTASALAQDGILRATARRTREVRRNCR